VYSLARRLLYITGLWMSLTHRSVGFDRLRHWLMELSGVGWPTGCKYTRRSHSIWCQFLISNNSTADCSIIIVFFRPTHVQCEERPTNNLSLPITGRAKFRTAIVKRWEHAWSGIWHCENADRQPDRSSNIQTAPLTLQRRSTRHWTSQHVTTHANEKLCYRWKRRDAFAQ